MRHPPAEELGLEACLVSLVDSWRSQNATQPMIQLDMQGDFADVRGTVAATAYRVAQECLTNSLRHSAAREIVLRIERRTGVENALLIRVEDDGGGDAARVAQSEGFGLTGSASAWPRSAARFRLRARGAASAWPPRFRSPRDIRMTASQTKGISILLVDDHPVVRQGYRRVLEHQSDFRVVAEADDAATAYRAFKAHAPDIVVMDISMPGASGLEAIRNIRMRHSASRILVFSMHSEAALVKAAFSAGASGYVTKSSEPAALVKAIRAVARGEHAMSDDIAHVLAMESLSPSGSALDQLGEREIEILRQLAAGATAEQIASNLNLSLKTVQNYHYLIKTKTGMRTDAQLVRLAIECGLASL